MSGVRNVLQSTSRLPEGWSDPSVFEDVVVADGVELWRAGLSTVATHGEEATGAAAETAASPLGRSYFELLERVSTLEALRTTRASYELLTIEGRHAGTRTRREVFPESDEPGQWRYARSNGVALHTDWQSACLRALWELAERDRIVRSWYGETRPRRLELAADSTPLRGARSYDWCAYAFPEPRSVTFCHGVHVVGVFGFPLCADVPLVFGYGARPEPRVACDAAVREVLQLLAFLWGEPVPAQEPELGPTAVHHLERFLYPDNHQILRRWLEGAHQSCGGECPPTTESRESGSDTVFVDLTPAWLGGDLRVAKALSSRAAPLAFGNAPFAGHLPPELRVHPIA